MTSPLTVTATDLDQWTLDAATVIPLTQGINWTAMIRAICTQESTYGAHPIPRHEARWCPITMPLNWDIAHPLAITRHRLWGCLACCAYGPMQALYHSLADYGLADDPRPLLDPHTAFIRSTTLLIRKVLKQRPRTVEAVADLWNSGDWRDSIHPTTYIANIQDHYLSELARLSPPPTPPPATTP